LGGRKLSLNKLGEACARPEYFFYFAQVDNICKLYVGIIRIVRIIRVIRVIRVYRIIRLIRIIWVIRVIRVIRIFEVRVMGVIL
jgi:hypothetical protein